VKSVYKKGAKKWIIYLKVSDDYIEKISDIVISSIEKNPTHDYSKKLEKTKIKPGKGTEGAHITLEYEIRNKNESEDEFDKRANARISYLKKENVIGKKFKFKVDNVHSYYEEQKDNQLSDKKDFTQYITMDIDTDSLPKELKNHFKENTKEGEAHITIAEGVILVPNK
jgi:hypothetical protein